MSKLEELKAKEQQSWETYLNVKSEHEKIDSIWRSKWSADHHQVRLEEERIELRKEIEAEGVAK